MKYKLHVSMLLLVSLMVTMCTKDQVDPNDYRDPHLPKDNTFVLRDGTYAMSPEDQSDLMAVEPEKLVYSSNSSIASSVQVGDIIVNPFGGEKGFIRKVTSVVPNGNQIELNTELAAMTDAFSSWYIDSRTDKLTIKPRSSWGETFDFKQEYEGVDFTFGGNVDPQFYVAPSYDDYELIYHWNENDSVYAFGPYMELTLENFRINFVGKVVTSFTGEVAWDAAPEVPITITQVPYANFLTLYVSPKLEVSGKFQGTFTSPMIGLEVGPYNVNCGYNNVTGELFWRDLPSNAITPLFNEPTIECLSGSFTPTMGVEFIIAPTGQYESGANNLAEAKLTLYAYEYLDFGFIHRGSFDDRQPRISFDAELGSGFNVGFELNAFKGVLTTGLSSDDYRYKWRQWNLANVNTCDAFPEAGITYTGGLVDISVTSGQNHGLGYQIYVNDSLFSEQVYGYNETNTIALPSSSQLVNKIAITDVNSLGCYLEDVYVDPSLVGNCSDKFVDPRDGNEYCFTDIGGVTWMAENLRYTSGGAVGKWYDNADTDENLIFGRLYTFYEIEGICPSGWHLPGNGEWNQLIAELGGRDEFGLNAKAASSVLWPGSALPSETTFGAVPAGEYYSWLEGSLDYSAYGNKGKFARFWSSTLLDGSPTMIEISAGAEAEVNTGESASLIGLSQYKSIREIGFSCRCVKD